MAGGSVLPLTGPTWAPLWVPVWDTEALVNGWYQAAKVLWVTKHRSPVHALQKLRTELETGGISLRGPSWDSWVCSCRAGCVFANPQDLPPHTTLPHSPMCLADSPEHYFCKWSRETQKNIILRTTVWNTSAAISKHGWVAWSLAKLLKNTWWNTSPDVNQQSGLLFWSFWVTSLDANMVPCE